MTHETPSKTIQIDRIIRAHGASRAALTAGDSSVLTRGCMMHDYVRVGERRAGGEAGPYPESAPEMLVAAALRVRACCWGLWRGR